MLIIGSFLCPRNRMKSCNIYVCMLVFVIRQEISLQPFLLSIIMKYVTKSVLDC